MIKATLSYIPMGIGSWNTVTVSREIAIALAEEYVSYGWPVQIDGEEYSVELSTAA